MPIRGTGDVDRREELLGPELVGFFDDAFVRSCDLYEEFVARLAAQVLCRLDLERPLAVPRSAAELAAAGGFVPQAAHALGWMLAQLAARGVFERSGDDRFRAARPIPRDDPGEILAAQRDHDAAALPSYAIASVAAAGYPSFLRGLASGEEILFSPDHGPLWFEYFSNDNPLYAINNTLAARAAVDWMPAGPLSVLEIGGGGASGALALLDRLEATGRLDRLASYRFTDLAPTFLRRGQRALASRRPGSAFLETGRLDMNAPFGPQGIEDGRFQLVYAVNTIHVAYDLALTLDEIRRALAPGGRIVFAECVRPLPGQPVYPEFVFNLLEAFRSPRLDPELRPNGGFLTPEQWQRALAAAGFADVRFVPDVPRIRDVYPSFFVAAVGATRGG